MDKIAQDNVLNLDKVQKDVSPTFKFTDLGGVVTGIQTILIPLAGIALIIYLLSGGLQLMTSKGDPKAVEGAKQKITNAVIGIVIIFAAFWIVQVLIQFLGIEGQTGKIFGVI